MFAVQTSLGRVPAGGLRTVLRPFRVSRFAATVVAATTLSAACSCSPARDEGAPARESPAPAAADDDRSAVADPVQPAPGAASAADSAELASLLARCRDAATYSREHDGDAMLVLRDGKAIFEDAAPGHTTGSLHALASGSKSFAGVAAMCAVADGLLSLDEPVCATIHEWRADPRKSKVTVRELLSLSSGLESLSAKIDTAASARAAGITDRARASIDARTMAQPGERFIYGPSSFYVFGELMRRKLAAAGTGDADIVAYLDRRIFAPLGIDPVFMRDRAGNPNLAGGCRIGAIEWARFGELIRNGGTHAGVSLLAPELVSELSRATGPNPRYGLTWWILGNDGEDAEDDVADTLAADRLESRGGPVARRLAERLREREGSAHAAAGSTSTDAPALGFMAAGKGKQRLYVLPEHGMTIVRLGALNGSRGFHDDEFLAKLLGPQQSARPPR